MGVKYRGGSRKWIVGQIKAYIYIDFWDRLDLLGSGIDF